MNAIYTPKGKAGEYAHYACNLFEGCIHGCRYCYVPSLKRKTLNEWSKETTQREGILQQLDKDAKHLSGSAKDLLFCFTSDPYQTAYTASITNQALSICQKYNLKSVNVLTKNPKLALEYSLPYFLQNKDWKLASTISFLSEKLREYWEPNAPPIRERIDAIKKSYSLKIKNWISLEPVVDAKEAISLIKELLPYVNFWKVGKINYFNHIEAGINWQKFVEDIKNLIPKDKLYIKYDLKKYEKTEKSETQKNYVKKKQLLFELQ